VFAANEQLCAAYGKIIDQFAKTANCHLMHDTAAELYGMSQS